MTEQIKKIAIRAQTEVQFFSVAPLIDELAKKYRVDFLLQKTYPGMSGFDNMTNNIFQLIKKSGYSVKYIEDLKPHHQYDLLLTTHIDGRVNAKCCLKYEYGTLNIKPSVTYTPEAMRHFHGFLCQSTVTQKLLSAYGQTFLVDNLRFVATKKQKNKQHTVTVLFAPTYNDQSLSLDDYKTMIEQLHNQGYHVVTKGHHATSYRTENQEQKNILQEISDEYYGPETRLTDLIVNADVCIFDNSSAISEALYAQVPCLIFTKDADYFKLGEMHTTQYELIQDGILPQCVNASEICETVKTALSTKIREKQLAASHEFFPQKNKQSIKQWIDAIEYFLHDPIAQDYILLHNLNTNHTDNLAKENMWFANEIKRYTSAKLHRLATRAYQLKERIKNVKS